MVYLLFFHRNFSSIHCIQKTIYVLFPHVPHLSFHNEQPSWALTHFSLKLFDKIFFHGICKTSISLNGCDEFIMHLGHPFHFIPERSTFPKFTFLDKCFLIWPFCKISVPIKAWLLDFLYTTNKGNFLFFYCTLLCNVILSKRWQGSKYPFNTSFYDNLACLGAANGGY